MIGKPHIRAADWRAHKHDFAALVVGVIAAACIILGSAIGIIHLFQSSQQGRTPNAAGITTLSSSATPKNTAQSARSAKPARSSGSAAKTAKPKAPGRKVDWHGPTGGAQPDLAGYSELSIDVDLKKQRVYVKSNGQTIYTMIASTGMDNTTPTGNFVAGGYAPNPRGASFYNTAERMGAQNWICIHDNILFHSVPTDINGEYIASEAEKLGSPASHGCIRLSIADSKWLYDQLPTGTPIHIY